MFSCTILCEAKLMNKVFVSVLLLSLVELIVATIAAAAAETVYWYPIAYKLAVRIECTSAGKKSIFEIVEICRQL